MAAAAIAPIAGSLSDLFGRRYVGLCGSLLIITGMIVVGAARSIELAIAGMAIMGLGSGIAMVIGIAGIAELAPVKSRGKYIGTAFIFVLPFGASSVWGTSFGITADGSANVLQFNHMEMGCMDICYSRSTELFTVGTVLLSPASTKLVRSRQRADPGAGRHHRRIIVLWWIVSLLTGSAMGRIYSVCFLQNRGNSSSWTSAQVISTILFGIFLALVFYGWEKTTIYPMLPHSLFAQKVSPH